MVLRKRLERIESRRGAAADLPQVILRRFMWRTTCGEGEEIGMMAALATADGWQTISRGAEESEPDFMQRIEAMKSGNVSLGP